MENFDVEKINPPLTIFLGPFLVCFYFPFIFINKYIPGL